MEQESTPVTILSEKRKALFEPLEPVSINGRRPTAESLLPPPDFDEASYPRGWLVGKKRKLVNVDVVESMRRIAVQEMNRKVQLLKLVITLGSAYMLYKLKEYIPTRNDEVLLHNFNICFSIVHGHVKCVECDGK